MKPNCSLANLVAAVCAAPYRTIFGHFLMVLLGMSIVVTIASAIVLSAYLHDVLLGKAWDWHLSETLPYLIGVAVCAAGSIGFGLLVDFKGTLKLVLYTAGSFAALAAVAAYLDWTRTVVGAPLAVKLWTTSISGKLFWAVLPARILEGVLVLALCSLNIFFLLKATSLALRSMCDYGARARAAKSAA